MGSENKYEETVDCHSQFVNTKKQKEKQWSDEYFHMDVNYMFNQMSSKKGIKLFDEISVSGILKEYMASSIFWRSIFLIF